MRLLPRGLSKATKITTVILSTLAITILALVVDSNRAKLFDRFLWPDSAHARIEGMASILRRIKSPARWCYPSKNPENIYDFDPKEEEKDFGRCMSSIAPVSEFKETIPSYYVRRFYRADIGDQFCEVTLSTVFEDDRVVGSDCYFGLFPKAKDTGIGMTDDKFG